MSGYAFNDSLDYRYRNYDNGERRDDKALRRNGAVSRTIRSRDFAELTGSWTRSLLDGKASASLAAFGGREFATHDRPDGDSDFVRLSPSLDFALTEHLGGFVFASWQHDRYNDERFNVGPSDEILGTGTRNDDHHEAGGGLTWKFKASWSLNPEILFIRDDGNIPASNYSSTELWITVRKDF